MVLGLGCFIYKRQAWAKQWRALYAWITWRTNRQTKANSPLHVSSAPKLCSIFTCSRMKCECVPKRIQILRDHPRKQNKHRSAVNCFFWSVLLTACKMRADKKNIDNWHSVYLTPLVLHHTLNRKKKKRRTILEHILVNLTHKTKSKGKDKKENGQYEFISNVAIIWFPIIFCLPVKQNSVLLWFCNLNHFNRRVNFVLLCDMIMLWNCKTCSLSDLNSFTALK